MVDQGRVIITGADTPTGLTTARALRDLPVEVIGVVEDLEAAPAFSRIWDRILPLGGGPLEQLDSLIERARKGVFEGPCILLFTQDSHVMAAWERLEVLRKFFIVPLPSWSDGEIMMDKTRFHQWAIENEVSVPRSEIVSSLADISSLASKFTFPCILKPLVRTESWDNVYRNKKFFFFNSQSELSDLLDSSDPFNYSPRYVLQEWIGGGDSAVFFVLFSLDDNGSIISEHAGRKYWQWPPLEGSTAVCHLIDDEELVSTARRVAVGLGMVGLGSVEFKRDPRDGRLLVTEPTVGRNNHQSGVALLCKNNPTTTLVAHYLALESKLYEPNKKHVSCSWVDELSAYRYAKSRGFFRSLLSLSIKIILNRRVRFLFFDLRDLKPFWVHLRKALLRNKSK